MHNIIFPLKDTTIYSKYPEVNTGLDEILEITKEVSSSNYFYRGQWAAYKYYKRFDYVSGSDGYYFAVAENIGEPTSSAYWTLFDITTTTENSRILLQFDLSQLEAQASASASLVYLNLFTSIAKKVPIEYTLNVHPITSTWEMGTGKFTDKLTNEGATWIQRTSQDIWTTSGGDFSAVTTASQIFNFVPTDIRMDITNIFNWWSLNDNNGIIIKRPESEESNRINYGSLSFYSLDTHTVYLPTLEVLYDDYIYDTSEFLVWNLKIYSTTTADSLNIDSASFKFNTTSATALNLETGSQSFVVGTSLDYDYIVGIPIYMTASVSSSAIMTGIVSNYDSISGDITASILTIQGPTGSYSNWYVNTPAGYTLGTGYRNQHFTVDPQLPYTTGQTFVMTASAGNYMNGTVISYDVITGDMTASITYATGSGSYSSWNVELAAGEEPGYSVTGSVSGSLISGSISVYMKNFMPTYQYNEVTRFRIIVKSAYQAKTFYEEARVGETYYLPSGSLKYSIRDAYSNRVMIPFSDYTKVSLDSTGHYFDVSLSGFMPERFYKIIFKYTENGVDQYIDKNSQFKVVK